MSGRPRTAARGAAALAAALGTTVAATALTTLPAHASPAGPHLVISEVYANGGNSGAVLDRDYVEIANPAGAPVALDGLSLQYRSASGTGAPASGQVVPLTGTVPAGGHYLVTGAAGTSGGASATPVGDAANPSMNLSATSGRVALVDVTAGYLYPAGSVTNDPHVLDLVGYGSAASYETAPAATPSDHALVRSGGDTDDNSVDLTTGDAHPPVACGTACDGDGGGGTTAPTDVSIEDIQGPGPTSPLVDQAVRTEGIVTADYPTGGFDGFYLQTAGTGGDLDLAGHTTSDAVFVYGATSAAAVHVGEAVQVTGTVSEYHGLTELGAAVGGVVATDHPLAAVKPAVLRVPTQEAQRESLEGMLVAPEGPYAVTDNYATNQYGEVGLAIGDRPLQTPTNVVLPDDDVTTTGSAYDRKVAWNAAHLITLDDGSSVNFLGADANKDIPLPWLTRGNEVRVGAAASFVAPVILDYRNGAWKLQPTQRLTGDDPQDAPATFSSTRRAAPADVHGDISIATFNVLNYFTTLGIDVPGCSPYRDRDGNPVTVAGCPGNGPRGAWDAADLARQQAKIVHAINGLHADVVSLEEIENNRAVSGGAEDRDVALATLVRALNADAGAGTWDYVRSPSTLPADEDVIRTAFIYRSAAVRPVGASVILDDPAFANARQPLAQAFQPAGAVPADRFVAIVNHFKSKGSGSGVDADQGDGQGASNHSRVLQAQALLRFVKTMRARAATPKVFLTGDFNSYAREDPVRLIEAGGFTDLARTMTDKETYQFGGTVGSLDHVFATRQALRVVTGADVWNINAYESVAREYSRYNYNVTDLYDASPYRASDHDPIVVGVRVRRPGAAR